MDDTTTRTRDDDEKANAEPRWPAIVGITLIIFFTWAGIEVFALQGRAIGTLNHDALVSDRGADLEIEAVAEAHVVQIWSFVPDGEDATPTKTPALVSLSILDPAGDVVAAHADDDQTAEARYLEWTPAQAGTYRIRVDAIEGDGAPQAEAVVYSSNQQILLPLLADLLD